MNSSNYKYQFTIFTPCYNSEKFIHRVYNSLKNQTFKDFEWLVINDASSDNTSSIIKKYIEEALFPIQFFDLKNNQMLTKNYNMAIKNANGRFFIPAGHDDEFEAESLEIFLKYWNSLKNENYAGISCLCMDQTGNLVGDLFPYSPYISDYFEIVFNKKVKGEKWGFIQTKILKENLLPENIDTYISEGLLWASIGFDYKTVYINEILRKYYINQPDYTNLSSINKTRFRYPNGLRFYNLQMINKYKSKVKSFTARLSFYYNFIRMSRNLKISFFKSIKEIDMPIDKLILIIIYPLGFILSTMDKVNNRI